MSVDNIPQSSISNLPTFSEINIDTIVDDVTSAIQHCKDTIESVVAEGDSSFNSIVGRIDEADDELSRIWSPIRHMNSVVSSDTLREAHDACLPLLSEYGTYVGQHKGLFTCYQTIQTGEEYKSLTQAQRKSVDNAVRDFKLSGVDLDQEAKAQYAEIQTKLSSLSSTFSNNLLDATMHFKYVTEDEEELSGLPESALAAAKQLAESKNKKGFMFTLDIPSYLPVMTYADSSELRERMYKAYVTRASEFDTDDGKFDNTAIIKGTLALRKQKAMLLGFDNYSEYSIASKMAETNDQVLEFLNALADKSKPQAQAEVKEIEVFAEQEFGKTELQAWDFSYFAEKLKQAKYSISDEQLRPYFPEDKAVFGLFEVISRLYNIDVVEVEQVDKWHEDVRFFELHKNGQVRGAFYLDLYAREKKRGGAWMDECQVRRKTLDGNVNLPVAYLTCNFNRPVGDKPALFTHDEVITLFHEFGHGIHHMLTQIEVSAVSGINGVAWDAVELPSQFLENWCWQPEALAFISGHYETGDPLPKEMLDKMLAAKNFQSAMQMLRQLEFSLFDYELHMQTSDELDVQAFIDKIRSRVAVIKPPSFNRFQNGFGHIFAGGYAAGYYSYKWAEVLSSDAFSRFEEEGIFNPDTGADFLHNILEMGGSKEPMELFKAFRGREPSIDPLLRHAGIKAAAA